MEQSISPSKHRNSTSQLRGENFKTYIISVPINEKKPKIKKGHVQEILKADTLEDIAKYINDAEDIAHNIHITYVTCSKCMGSCNNIFSRCRIKSKVSAV